MIPEPVTATRRQEAAASLPRAAAPLRAGRILAVANQKGGVGKTTTTINLATALAACGKEVLIVDLDPQGNASTGLGLDPQKRKITVYDVLMGERPLEEAVIDSPVPHLQIVPASVELSGAEIELVGEMARENRLRGALGEAAKSWDYILIDCPPALGLLTLNAMVAAHAVLVPLQAEFYALEGLSHLLRTIERVRRALNPELRIQGVVLTMYDKRNNLCDMVAKDVRDYLGAQVYETMIPRNVRISEAPSHGKPVLLYDFRCAGAQAYIRLAREMLRREEAPPSLAAIAS